MICVLCVGVAACYRNGVYNVWWCGRVLYVWCMYCVGYGSVLYVWFVYCVVVWQLVIDFMCLLCGGVAEYQRYDVYTVWWCGIMS